MATRFLRLLHLRRQALSLWKGSVGSVGTVYMNQTLLLRRIPGSALSVVNSLHKDVDSGIENVDSGILGEDSQEISELSQTTDSDGTRTLTLETRLRSARCPEDIWKEVSSGAFTEGLAGDNAVLAISKLTTFSRTKKGEGVTNGAILRDPNFIFLCNLANEKVRSIFTGSVINLLRNLLILGMSPESNIIKSVETEVRWRMRRLNIHHLCSLAQLPMHDSPTESQKELMSEVLRNLDMRWTELHEPRTVVQLMVTVGHLSTALMEKLEDKVLEMGDQLTQEETARVLKVLANRSRRTVPLLRALAYHLSRRQFRLDTDVSVIVAYAFATLNFPNTPALEKISADLVDQVPQLKPPTLISFAKSYSYLKWRDPPLMEAMAAYVLANLKFLTEEQVANFLLAYGRLDFTPDNADHFYSQVLPYVTAGLPSLPKWMQLDLVWSLAILGRLTPDLVATVLTPSFYQPLTEGLSFKAQAALLKVLHINTCARQELTGYSGPLLTDVACHPSKIHVTPGKNNKAALPVIDTIATVVGGLHKLRSEVITPYGWTIDCEFVLDKENRGLTVHEYQAKHIPGDQSQLKQLPDGSHRFATLVWEYGNYCHQSKKLLGRFTMCRRHLQAANFTLLEVPFYEWKELKSEFQRVEYMKDKIRKAIAEEAANVL